MSNELIVVKLSPSGPMVLAETAGSGWEVDDSFGRVADPVKALSEAPASVDQALEKVVVPAAKVFMRRLRELSPDQVDFEFGLKLSGKAGLVFASAESEAHITVKLQWKPTAS